MSKHKACKRGCLYTGILSEDPFTWMNHRWYCERQTCARCKNWRIRTTARDEKTQITKTVPLETYKVAQAAFYR